MTGSGCDDAERSCPICLEDMTRSERSIYPLPCSTCDFNFCNNCVENFCKAAEDDFQIASDGSRQVKVHVSCPQCRSKYPLDDLEDTVLLLRSAHSLAESVMEQVEEEAVEETKEESGCVNPPKYRLLRDSELTASQLARKMEFTSNEAREQLREAAELYEYALKQRKDVSEEAEAKGREERQAAKAKWNALLEQLPAEPDNACQCGEDVDFCDGSCGSRNSIEVVLQNTSYSPSPSPTPSPRKTVVDETLFQGFDEFINKDERVFLTDLFTDGDVRSVSQAALIMNGVRRLALQGKHHKAIGQENLSKQELQQKIDRIEERKVRFPLPNHMPGYFLIPTYSYREGYMTLKDKAWDGTMTPPQRSKRVFEKVYAKAYTRPRPKTEYPIQTVTIRAVQGPIGRLGLRRDDIITHVDDTEWHGTAEDLQNYIYECHRKHPKNEISICVNTTPETCEFLKVRNELMMRQLREEAARKKQQALIRKQQQEQGKVRSAYI